MSFRSEAVFVLAAGSLVYADSGPATAATTGSPAPPALTVCADPNNLPFSNQREEGFENRIAAVVARDLGRQLRYYWWPQRRGFIRNTLNARRCDVVINLPTTLDLVLASEPYYRSTYVFVSRADRHLALASLDDPRLRRLRIGIHVSGDDYDNPPAAQALAKRGIVANVRGYTLYGDYSRPNPPAELIYAVSRGEIDVAIAWGPFAGYFARESAFPLRIAPVTPAIDLPFLPFVFDMGAGVRRGDTVMLREIQGALDRRHDAIRRILTEFGVPLADAAEP